MPDTNGWSRFNGRIVTAERLPCHDIDLSRVPNQLSAHVFTEGFRFAFVTEQVFFHSQLQERVAEQLGLPPVRLSVRTLAVWDLHTKVLEKAGDLLDFVVSQWQDEPLNNGCSGVCGRIVPF